MFVMSIFIVKFVFIGMVVVGVVNDRVVVNVGEVSSVSNVLYR